jgi:hypothetical protein
MLSLPSLSPCCLIEPVAFCQRWSVRQPTHRAAAFAAAGVASGLIVVLGLKHDGRCLIGSLLPAVLLPLPLPLPLLHCVVELFGIVSQWSQPCSLWKSFIDGWFGFQIGAIVWCSMVCRRKVGLGCLAASLTAARRHRCYVLRLNISFRIDSQCGAILCSAVV